MHVLVDNDSRWSLQVCGGCEFSTPDEVMAASLSQTTQNVQTGYELIWNWRALKKNSQRMLMLFYTG